MTITVPGDNHTNAGVDVLAELHHLSDIVTNGVLVH
jgi:hypothetical protein